MAIAADGSNSWVIGSEMPVGGVPRQPGALCGQIEMAEDFDLLPEDVLAAMEG